MLRPLPTLQTPRLQLRPYTEDDRAWFVAIFCDPVVMRHVDGALAPAAADALFTGILDGSRERVFASWCAEVDGTPVGHGALLREGDDLEVGFILSQRAWGQGYATEIARAVSEFGQRRLAGGRLIATVDADHPASRRVLTKVGMTVVERVEDPDGPYLVCALRGLDN